MRIEVRQPFIATANRELQLADERVATSRDKMVTLCVYQSDEIENVVGVWSDRLLIVT